jgi:peptidoglycan/xylan/chitin deacetylase (PgdA/CDA1 family)
MIKGKRALLANLIYHSQAFRGLKYFDSRTLVIFNYHRIRSDVHSPRFDDGVYGPTQDELHDQFKWMKLNADVISEQDLLDHVRTNRKLPRSSVMITFDDGYRDNYELALPVIQDLKVPAIFFIATGAIESREVGWWDTIAYLIKRSPLKQLTLRGRTWDLEGCREGAIRELQHWMRTKKAETTIYFLEELSMACDVPMPTSDESSPELMSWDEIRDAQAKGVAIGSHTHTHRVLSTLNLADQFEEFRSSKEILEEKLGRTVHSVAYPVGGHIDCHFETSGLAEQCGYELGFSFQTGANHLDRLNPFEIGRISAEESLPLTCAAISLPSVFARSRYSEKPKSVSLSSHYVPTPHYESETIQ